MSKVTIIASGEVEIQPGSQISWKSNVSDAYTESRSFSGLTINQVKRGGGSSTIISGGNVTQINSSGSRNVVIGGGQNVVISDGEVWINGKRVDGDNSTSSYTPSEIPKLTVYVPSNTDVEIKTSGSSDVYGNAEIGNLSIKTSGSTDVKLNCNYADLQTSGSSTISLIIRSGKMKSSFSGSTQFQSI